MNRKNSFHKLVSSVLVVTMFLSNFCWGMSAGQRYLRAPASKEIKSQKKSLEEFASEILAKKIKADPQIRKDLANNCNALIRALTEGSGKTILYNDIKLLIEIKEFQDSLYQIIEKKRQIFKKYKQENKLKEFSLTLTLFYLGRVNREQVLNYFTKLVIGIPSETIARIMDEVEVIMSLADEVQIEQKLEEFQTQFKEKGLAENISINNLNAFIYYLAKTENINFLPPRSMLELTRILKQYELILKIIDGISPKISYKEIKALISALYFTSVGEITVYTAIKYTGFTKEQINFIATNGGKSVDKEFAAKDSVNVGKFHKSIKESLDQPLDQNVENKLKPLQISFVYEFFKSEKIIPDFPKGREKDLSEFFSNIVEDLDKESADILLNSGIDLDVKRIWNNYLMIHKTINGLDNRAPYLNIKSIILSLFFNGYISPQPTQTFTGLSDAQISFIGSSGGKHSGKWAETLLDKPIERNGYIDLAKEVLNKVEGKKAYLYNSPKIHSLITSDEFTNSFIKMIKDITSMAENNLIDKEKYAANEEFTKEVAMILNLVSYGQVQKKNAAKYLAKVYYEKMNKKKEKYLVKFFGSSEFEQGINTIFDYISTNKAKELSTLLEKTIAEKFGYNENKIFEYSINLLDNFLEKEKRERIKFYQGFDRLGGNVLKEVRPWYREKIVKVIARMITEGILDGEKYKDGKNILDATIFLAATYPPPPNRELILLAKYRKVIDPKLADKYFGIKKEKIEKIITEFKEAEKNLIKKYWEIGQWENKRKIWQSYFREHFKEELTIDNIKNFINYLALKENLNFRPPKSKDKIEAVRIKYGELLMTIKAREMNYGEQETVAMILALYFTDHIYLDKAEKSTGLTKEQINFIGTNGGRSVDKEFAYRKNVAKKIPYLLQQAFNGKGEKIKDYSAWIIKQKLAKELIKKITGKISQKNRYFYFADNFPYVLSRMDKVISRMIEEKGLIKDWEEYITPEKVLDAAIILAWEHTTKGYRDEYTICNKYFNISKENSGKIENIFLSALVSGEADDKWQKLSEEKDEPLKIANRIIEYFDNDNRKKLYLEDDIKKFLEEYHGIDEKIYRITANLSNYYAEENGYKGYYEIYPFLKLFQENEKARTVLTLIFLGHIYKQRGIIWLVNNGFDRNNQLLLDNAIQIILDNTKITIISKLTEQIKMSSFSLDISLIGTILAGIANNPAFAVSDNAIPNFRIEYIFGFALITGIYVIYSIVNNLNKAKKGSSLIGEKLREKNPSLEASTSKFVRNIWLSL